MAKWTKAADCKSGILGSNPSAASTFYNLSAGGGMADTRDLKSLGRRARVSSTLTSPIITKGFTALRFRHCLNHSLKGKVGNEV